MRSTRRKKRGLNREVASLPTATEQASWFSFPAGAGPLIGVSVPLNRTLLMVIQSLIRRLLGIWTMEKVTHPLTVWSGQAPSHSRPLTKHFSLVHISSVSGSDQFLP